MCCTAFYFCFGFIVIGYSRTWSTPSFTHCLEMRRQGAAAARQQVDAQTHNEHANLTLTHAHWLSVCVQTSAGLQLLEPSEGRSNYPSPTRTTSFSSWSCTSEAWWVSVWVSACVHTHSQIRLTPSFPVTLLQQPLQDGSDPDPYVKLYLLPDPQKTSKKKTRAARRTCNPTYNQMVASSSSSW